MRHVNKILVTFAILLFFACQPCVGDVTIFSVNITPSQPSDSDLITFNIRGGTGFGPSEVIYDQFSQNGTSLQLDLHLIDGAGVNEWFGYSKQIQPLPANTYTLEVRAFDDSLPELVPGTYDTGFTVTPEPCTFAILGFGLPFLRMFSRRKS